MYGTNVRVSSTHKNIKKSCEYGGFRKAAFPSCSFFYFIYSAVSFFVVATPVLVLTRSSAGKK
jgi:hypothetical protein